MHLCGLQREGGGVGLVMAYHLCDGMSSDHKIFFLIPKVIAFRYLLFPQTLKKLNGHIAFSCHKYCTFHL